MRSPEPSSPRAPRPAGVRARSGCRTASDSLPTWREVLALRSAFGKWLARHHLPRRLPRPIHGQKSKYSPSTYYSHDCHS